MKSLLDIIKPITLLAGHHDNTGRTGHGCAMDVVSYLAGDRKITDHPQCACPVVTEIVIPLNDWSKEWRERLLPYIQRISGSRSDDRAILVRRAELCAEFAEEMALLANRPSLNPRASQWAADAAWSAKAARQAIAPGDAAAWSVIAASSALFGGKSTSIGNRMFRLLDDLLALTPDRAETPELIERARSLVELAEQK